MVNMENYEEYLMLYADGEMSEAEHKALLHFMEQHPELKDELAQYEATRLTPDTSIIYEHKEALLKKPATTISLRSWWIYGAAAACVALFVLLLNNKPEGTKEPAVIAKKAVQPATQTPVAENTDTVAQSIAAVKEEPKTETPVKTTTARQQTQKPAIAYNPKPTNINKPVQSPQVAQPVVPHKEETHIAISKPATQTQKTLTQPNPEPVQPETPAPTAHTLPGTDDRKDRSALLALLPVKEEGLSEMENAFNKKIDNVREFRNKLRDTDVSVRIGKKELFTVRL